jgi:arylsulfatase A-like enzyme
MPLPPRVVCVLVGAFALAGCQRASRPSSPNVVLISIDTLRADHLSCYGYVRRTTPNIDRLAQEGTLVTQAYASSSWTIPSHMTMLTGLPPSRHGVDRPGRSLARDHVTLAERLRGAGYQTAAFVSGPTLHRAFGFDHGFALYDNTMAFVRRDFVGGDSTMPSEQVQRRAHQAVTGPRVRAAVERWLDHGARPPFFLFVHLWDPHYDYIPRPPYDTRFDPGYLGDFDFSDVPFNPRINPRMPEREREHLVALYDGEIAATDAVVGALSDALERHGWLADTLLVVTADHGEEFFDHGHKGHMRSLFEEMIHVPLVVRFPGRVPAGRRLDAIFASVHLMPTILGLLGLPAPPLAPARDLSAMLRGGPVPPDLWAFAELAHGREHPLYAVRVGQRKYVGEIGEQAEVLVEDLATDAAEQHPTPADAGERRAFATWVGQAIGELRPADPTAGLIPALDPETRRELGALGYIIGP